MKFRKREKIRPKLPATAYKVDVRRELPPACAPSSFGRVPNHHVLRWLQDLRMECPGFGALLRAGRGGDRVDPDDHSC